MRIDSRLRTLALCALVLTTGWTLQAQGHQDRDHQDGPPGQAKKHDHGDKGMPPGQAKKYGDSDRGMPPGQAKKYFRDDNRGDFYRYYHQDTDRWRARRRPMFVPGQVMAPGYTVRVVPRSVWVNMVAPPPPGYQYGYYGGYVVAYNPTTRIIADVLDLVSATQGR
jgi:hypothetical protein